MLQKFFQLLFYCQEENRLIHEQAHPGGSGSRSGSGSGEVLREGDSPQQEGAGFFQLQINKSLKEKLDTIVPRSLQLIFRQAEEDSMPIFLPVTQKKLGISLKSYRNRQAEATRNEKEMNKIS